MPVLTRYSPLTRPAISTSMWRLELLHPMTIVAHLGAGLVFQLGAGVVLPG